MKALSEYISPLLKQLNQKQIRENTEKLADKLVENQTGQLWTLSENENEYNKYNRMLNGELQSIVDVDKLNVSLLFNSIDFFKDKSHITVVHDGSDIRKKYSKKLEGLDIVRDLEGNLVNGYPTFNSVAIDINGKEIRLLQSSPYSTKDANYLSPTDISDYHTGKLLKARRKEVEILLESGDWYNQNSLVEAHVNRINEQIRLVNPDAIIVHVYDRGHDNASLFEHHTEEGSYFVIRVKLNRNSNELTINEKGKEVAIKLAKQQFFNGFEKYYDKIRFKKKNYYRVRGVFEWSNVEINGRTYSVVKVRFYAANGQRIFKQPMLLMTNFQIDSEAIAELMFEIYMNRSRIEGVFKFCKQELGWENFRIRKFEGIKNLLALVYFIAGYFYEIESDLIEHPAAQWLAKLGNGKGKVTPYYILKGIGKLAQFTFIQDLLNQSEEDKELAQQAIHSFSTKDFLFE